MKMALVPVDGSTPVIIDRAILFFGRAPECDVVLTTSRKVSRKHCCISQIDEKIVVSDLGSMNGVRINDVAIEGHKTLKVGETVWIGDIGYRLAVITPGKQNPANFAQPSSGKPLAVQQQAGQSPVAPPPSSAKTLRNGSPLPVKQIDLSQKTQAPQASSFDSGPLISQSIPQDEIIAEDEMSDEIMIPEDD